MAITSTIKKYILLCLKSWKLFLASALLFTALAAAYAWTKLPVTEIDAQLMLKSDDGGATSFMYGDLARSFGFGDMLGMTSSTDNEVMVIQSHTVFRETAIDLGLNTAYYEKVKLFKWKPLYGDKRPICLISPAGISDTLQTSILFEVNREEGDNVSVKVKARKKTIFAATDKPLPLTIDIPYGQFTIDKTPSFDLSKASKMKIALSSYDAVAEAYVKEVKVFAPSRKTDFITLSYITTDADFGKLLLATIINNYNSLGNDEKNMRTNSSLRLVNDRLATLTREMMETEERMEQFKRNNNLTDVEMDAQVLIAKSSDIESNLLKMQTETEILKLTLEYINDKENNYNLIPDLLPADNASSTAATAKNQISAYNELILERMRLTSSAKENNTAIRALDTQIDALRANIQVSVKRAYDNSLVALNDMKRENSRVSGRIGQIPALERQYLEIKRIAELQNQMYIFLLQQKEEYTLNMASRTISAVTIDPPHALIAPVGLSKMKVVAVGLFLGLLFPALFLFKFRFKRIPCSSLSSVTANTKAPVVGSIDKCSDDDRMAVLSNSCSNAEKIRKLRSDLSLLLSECNGKTVLVTSPNQCEGKTLLAINLATSYAVIGKKVLLVDANLRNPQVAADLGISSPSAALADYADGRRAQIEVRKADITGSHSLDVVTGAPCHMHPADVIATKKVTALIDSMKEDYDIVIIDSSSINSYSDTFYWADVADITLMLVRRDVTAAEDINMIEKLYDEGRLPRIALVTNEF